MDEREFNLLEEAWVKVLTKNMEHKEVSLVDCLVNAHEYQCLAGECATQDAAMMRFLLAIVETVFYRYEVDGTEEELSEENESDPSDVLERWKQYWDKGRFSVNVIRDYLEEYGERFWLFHPDTPFYQVGNLQYGTDFSLACLYGNLKESNNSATKHHFSMGEGEALERMSYAEAARWLIHMNAYAVNVKKNKSAPGEDIAIGIGRLGSLGYLMVAGDTLFTSLLLNLCALKDGRELWDLPVPSWEEEVCSLQARRVSVPTNIPSAYTIQSRRMMLKREYGFVTGIRVLGGDFYDSDGGIEQMTLWKVNVEKKTKTVTYSPKKHNSDISAWREFPAIVCDYDNGRKPGLVCWMETLIGGGLISRNAYVVFRMIGMEYDGMSYSYERMYDDTMNLSAGLMSNMGLQWRGEIADEVAKCQEVAEKISLFCSNVAKIVISDDKNKSKEKAIKKKLTQGYYERIDAPFREWLHSIDPSDSKHEDKRYEWHDISRACAQKVVREYISLLGPEIFRIKSDNSLTIPGSYNLYLRNINIIYPKNDTEGK